MPGHVACQLQLVRPDESLRGSIHKDPLTGQTLRYDQAHKVSLLPLNPGSATNYS